MQAPAPDGKSNPPAAAEEGNEFFDALRKGALIGAALLVLILPPWHLMRGQQPAPASQQQAAVQPQARPGTSAPGTATPGATAGAPAPSAAAPQGDAVAGGAPVPAPQDAPLGSGSTQAPGRPQLRLADFGSAQPSPEVRLVANWAVHTRNHGQRSIVILDKKQATVHVLDPRGKLVATTPVLLGSATGDDTFPGVGDKPLSQIKPFEKTTPAGRFVAEPGVNHTGEDIVWVDYDAAVSMHRVRPNVKAERRLERLASATAEDNRISFGCINMPVKFFEQVLSPTVRKTGAIVYVLPEVRGIPEVLGAWDVTAEPPAWARNATHPVQQVSLR